jgi:sulfatase maturation enzyme AslB (radical SAM superfamily)
MNNVYCKAPWTSVSYMPGGKYSPCCAWSGNTFNSREEMTETVGGAFLRGEVPRECANPCPPDRLGWREMYKNYETDYTTHKINFLDFRNNNLCNLKCRSCGPGFSTSWSSELGVQDISLYNPVNVADMDLSECKQIYFAGGEPLLNPQHYQVLEKLIAQGADPAIMYSTNMTVLGAKSKHVKDLWPSFSFINVHASIDAVGKYAGIVRSGSDWTTVESNLKWVLTQPNCNIKIATVISAINIWWLPELLEYFVWLTPDQFEPVLANVDAVIGLGSIPDQYRAKLITMLEQSKFANHVNMRGAVDALRNQCYNETNWYHFLAQQMIQDNYRNEKWFDNLPVKHNIYRETLQIG